MIIRSEDIQSVCSKILPAVDTSEISTLTETLELKTSGKTLYINVTNREYYVRVKLDLGEQVDFHATVNAIVFLKLISQITTETVEINVNDSFLNINANGSYKLPLIYNNDKLLELPEIIINNVSSQFDVNGDILLSILNYNGKEISKGTAVRPVQKLYYIDENGAITFTTGACVNNFKLENPVKLLLNQKVVRLFKLFKNEVVKFTVGHDAITDEITQTKVGFDSDSVSITAIVPSDDSLISSVPVAAIRKRATNNYPFTVSINKNAFMQAINRLLLFTESNGLNKTCGNFEFNKDYVILKDNHNINSEKLLYASSLADCSYKNSLDLADLKSTLEGCSEDYVSMSFGDRQAIILSRNNVYNVIPELVNM